MRLDILNRGYSPATKLLFAVIRLFSGHPVPDAAKLVFYRPDFYGGCAKEFTHEAMRGPSAWSVADGASAGRFPERACTPPRQPHTPQSATAKE